MYVSSSQAADLLDVPQPTLSRQVRALELEIRAGLLHRHGRGVTLTPAGARFLVQAKGLLHSADVALAELHEGDARLRGRVACGLTPNVGRVMIPAFVKAFSDQLPFAELTVLNQLSAQLHDYLRASRIDFAIVHNPPPTASLHVEPLGSQTLHLVGTKQIGPDAESVDLKMLAGVQLIMPTALHVTRQPLELAAAQLRVNLNIRYEIDAVDSLFQLVNDGFAHTVSTRIAIFSGLVGPDLIKQRIVNPSITTDLFLVSPLPQNMTPLQVQALALARSIYHSKVQLIEG